MGSYYELCHKMVRSHGKIVFTNGCFDLIHPGHIDVLRVCREIAGTDGRVVVGLNSDESVKRLKGQDRPVNSHKVRKTILDSIRYVDHVIIFHEDTPLELIEGIRPDVIVKGGDYKVEDVVGHDIAPVVIVSTRNGFSSSSLIERIKR